MYIKVFKKINDIIGQNINMTQCHLDFELASGAAILSLYPSQGSKARVNLTRKLTSTLFYNSDLSCELKRCCFHLLQGIAYLFCKISENYFFGYNLKVQVKLPLKIEK